MGAHHATDGTPAATPFRPRAAAFLIAEALSAIGSWATIIAIWGYATYEYGATPGEVALLSALHGVASTVSHPALQSMPPRLVDDAHLARTNALVSLTDELALVLGPVAAGVGIGLFGFHGAFVFDAVTYAVGLAVLPLVRLRPVARSDAADDDDGSVRFRHALEGWKLIARTGVLRRVVACTFIVHLLYGTALLAEPLYVRDVLHRSEGVFAALQTVFGVFLVAGGVVTAKLGDRVASFRFVAIGVGLSGLMAIVYLGTPFVAVSFVGVALWGVATAAIGGPSRTVLHRAAPQRAHGRVLAADLVAASGAELLGVAAAGLLVSAFGVRWTIVGLGLFVAGWALGLLLADRRDTPAAAPDDDPEPSHAL